jgi:ABC-type nickel/cobalt efflux system permease component RcnA
MGTAIAVLRDYSSRELRRLATRVKDARQARRLLAIAAVLDGSSREEAAKIGGMDRQTLRDWVIRFNEEGPDGLVAQAKVAPVSIAQCCAGNGHTNKLSVGMPVKTIWQRNVLHVAVLAAAVFGLLLVAGLIDVALAQGVPFGAPRAQAPAVPVGGVLGWIFAKQAEFYRQFSSLIRVAKADGTAPWGLLGLSFLYGIFHAAGPGHGKAVISSYLVANQETWTRGVVLSFASALLQALVAVALVGVAAALLNATAATMNRAVNAIEIVSYSLIIVIGVRLLWVKGRACITALRTLHRPTAVGAAVTPAHLRHGDAHHAHDDHGDCRHDHGHDHHGHDHDHHHHDACHAHHHDCGSSNVPSCLVLDVRLPGVSGLDFQAELGKADVRIPLVFITGHGYIPMTVRPAPYRSGLLSRP